MIKPQFFLFFYFFIFFTSIKAQVSLIDSVIKIPFFNIHYSYQYSAGNLSERFGNNSNIGFSFHYKDKKNFLYGVEGAYIFGEDVKEDPIKNYRISNGQIISKEGIYALIGIYERGFYTKVNFGKIFSVFLKPNKNSGFVVLIGVGFLQHKIHYEVDRNTVLFLQDDYVKGFDRLTNGAMISQFVGYKYFSNRRLLNFLVGYEFIEAFTKNRRLFNFDTREKDNTNRTDIFHGFKVGISIALYKKVPKKRYYN